MSLRRSRIKPAINLAASRRSAVGASSRPKVQSGDAKSATNPTQPSSLQHSKVNGKDEPKQKESHAPISSVPTEEGRSEGNVPFSTRETTDRKNNEVDKGLSDKSDPRERTGEDEHSETTRTSSPAEEQGKTNLTSSITTEDKGDTIGAQETNKNVGQVRRKRITAVPNIGRRRLSSPVRELPVSRQKQSDGKTDAKKEVKTSSNPSEIQEEQGRKENKAKSASGDSKRKDSADGEPREDSTVRPSGPPLVQRKVLSQVFQTQGEQLHEESPSLQKKDESYVQKDAKKPEIQEKESAVAEPVEKSRKDHHRQKLSSSGNIYQKRLIEMQEGKKEETPSYKRKKYSHDPENGIDTSKMKMKDLIYYNPKENKMLQMNGSSKQVKEKYPEDEEEMEEMTSSPSTAAPQVKIGPDGQIILDRQSLVQVVTPKRKLDESEMTEVKEDSSTTTYSSFRKPRHTSVWSKEDTEKFYRAISTVGTDFSMINAIFPNRERRELKNKFKREEKLHSDLMDRALRDVQTFDFSDFQNTEEEEISVDKSANAATENDKSFKKPLKKKRRRRKDYPEDLYIAPKGHQVPVPIVREDENNITEEPSQPAPTESSLTTSTSEREPEEVSAEERSRALRNLHDPFGTESSPVDRNSSDEEEDYDMELILGKPTRSGRKPKQREVFTIQEPLSQPRVVRTNHKSIPQQNSEPFRKKNRKSKSKRVKRLPQTPLIVTDTKLQVGSHPATEDNHPCVANSSSSMTSHSQQVAYNSALSSNGIALLDHNMSPQREDTHPPVRMEHYLVTYPDGRRTLIQMPVPAVAENLFDFVLNVMPSPVRHGNVLQLGVVPRIGSPSYDPSQAGGSSGVLPNTLNQHSLSNSRLPHQRVVKHERPREVPQNQVLSVENETSYVDLSPETLSSEARQQSILASELQRNITQNSQGGQSSSFILHNIGSPNTAASSLTSGVHFQADRGMQLRKSLETNLSRTQNLKREIVGRTEGYSEGTYSSIENSTRSMLTEMVYVTDLVEPLPPSGSEVSDPIIAQQIDVSSSVQTDEVDGGESEAFVPI